MNPRAKGTFKSRTCHINLAAPPPCSCFTFMTSGSPNRPLISRTSGISGLNGLAGSPIKFVGPLKNIPQCYIITDLGIKISVVNSIPSWTSGYGAIDWLDWSGWWCNVEVRLKWLTRSHVLRLCSLLPVMCFDACHDCVKMH